MVESSGAFCFFANYYDPHRYLLRRRTLDIITQSIYRAAMAVEINLLLEEDAYALVKLHYRAFSGSISHILFSSEPSETSYRLMARQRARRLADPTTRAFKAVEKRTGQVIGAIVLMIAPDGLSLEEQDKQEPLMREFAPEQRPDCWRGLEKCCKASYARAVGTKPCVEVYLLVVEPEWQGKGIGSMLLQESTREADR